MESLTRIILGVIVIVLGFSMVYKTPWYLSIIGRIYWAEKNLGSGGTRMFYKLLGTLIIFFGIIIVTDLFEIFFGSFLLSLFGAA